MDMWIYGYIGICLSRIIESFIKKAEQNILREQRWLVFNLHIKTTCSSNLEGVNICMVFAILSSSFNNGIWTQMVEEACKMSQLSAVPGLQGKAGPFRSKAGSRHTGDSMEYNAFPPTIIWKKIQSISTHLGTMLSGLLHPMEPLVASQPSFCIIASSMVLVLLACPA